MTDVNPLKRYFRQPAMYLRLPTQGKWYDASDVETNADHEIAVYGFTALDEILLNTPDALLNGTALEKVIQHCAPEIKNVKQFLIPDLEALFLAMKVATNQGKMDFDRNCPNCGHENNFEVNCQSILDMSSFIEESDAVVNINDQLTIYVKPYTFEMRQLFMKREMEEQQTLRMLEDTNTNMDDITKAQVLGESIERLSRITFQLVSKSIVKVHITDQNIMVTDPDHISEWLISITKPQADVVMGKVNELNNIGVPKEIPATCTKCQHEWKEQLSFDPVSFFGRR